MNLKKWSPESVTGHSWKYLAEGNANVTLKNVEGDAVLRIRKSNSEFVSCKLGISKMANAWSFEDELQFHEFVELLFDEQQRKYLVPVQMVRLPKMFLLDLSKDINRFRSDFRKCKYLDVNTDHVQILPNLHRFGQYEDCISVELKPKCGFVPDHCKLLKTDKMDCKVCRFCMHQFEKVAQGKVDRKSLFCPIDLYGSCSCHVKHALKSLLMTPQNNICVTNFEKVFSGKIDVNNNFDIGGVYSEHLIKILTTVFLHDANQDESIYFDRETEHGSCSLSTFKGHTNSCKVIPPKGIFGKLKSLQQLDDKGIKYIYSLYSETSKEDLDMFNNFNSVKWREFMKCFHENNFGKCDPLINITKYLISATFKDVSVMVTFTFDDSRSDKFESFFLQDYGMWCVYQIKLLDLDAKYVHNIPFYFNLDQEIIRTFAGESACR